MSQFCSALLERRVVCDASRQSSRHGDFHPKKRAQMKTLRKLRNFWIPCVTTIVLGCFRDAFAQTSYRVTGLGVLPNRNLGCAMGLNDRGWTEVMEGTLAAGTRQHYWPILKRRCGSAACAPTDRRKSRSLHPGHPPRPLHRTETVASYRPHVRLRAYTTQDRSVPKGTEAGRKQMDLISGGKYVETHSR